MFDSHENWDFQISNYKEHNWSIAPATVLWNPLLCVKAMLLTDAPSRWVSAAGTLRLRTPVMGDSAPDSLTAVLSRMLPLDPLFFLAFLLYPVSGLHFGLLAFSAFPSLLAASLMCLSPDESLTHLILSLATSWRTWNNTLWEPLPFISIPLAPPLSLVKCLQMCYCLTWHWNCSPPRPALLPCIPFFSIIL